MSENLSHRIQVNKVGTFTGHRDCVYAIEKASNPYQFFSAAGDGLVVQWDLQNPDQGKLLAQIGASVYALHFEEERQLLWIGQNFDGLHVIDLVSQKEIGSVKITESAIFDIQIWEESVYVATGDGTVIMLDKETLTIRKQLKLSDKSARCLAINIQSNDLAVGYSDHQIRILDLKTLTLKHTLEGHTNSVFTVAYSPDSQLLVSAGRDAQLKIWDVGASYSLYNSIVAHMYAINHITFHPDGHYFATGSMDKSIKVWDALSFRLLKVIDKARHAGHGTSVNKLLWTDYHSRLVSASDDRTLSIWAIDNLP
ncbi:WD40 repeat domain-containing protein [Xanthocytophaga agilis]|uniref:WD40 repeat domain-containing protein n=1 Tax=Xanthocytophaga agilis TaxID=3048010 RepID=UPI0028D16514|nr:WD40 repeat domain-containing protein [Xanthocytophaga agilis]